jgi:D-beta-D-heptose 7-phosphate kinase/D-beta-D-heptose 1-phosphate adenosyltransferase
VSRLTVVGDALLDRDIEGDVSRLAPDAPVPVVDHDHTTVRPGGAGLAAALAARGRDHVRLITALADDPAGRELAGVLADHGVEVIDLGLDGCTPEKIRVRAQGRALLRLDRGGPHGVVGDTSAAARAAVEWADALLVADYGRGGAAAEGLRPALHPAAGNGVPLVWDPHPRGPEPVPGATLVTPNDAEARGFAPAVGGEGPHGALARAEALRDRWSARWVCVTRGSGGAVAVGDGAAVAVPATRVAVGDPCGAGDRFASRAAEVLAAGGDVPEALRAAVAAASAFVAAGGAAAAGCGGWDGAGAAAFGAVRAAPATGCGDWDGAGAAASGASDGAPPGMAAAGVIARVRAEGGTVVATGGCFDLLHPGHVRTLQAARALGDCLVVCLNSDASVRRLKGPRRPVVEQADRAAVLLALGCVDAVEVFDEATPVAVLEHLRPDLWVKGGDYAVRDLPEAAVLATWGGRALVLPFLEGRSTTRLIEEAALHAV